METATTTRTMRIMLRYHDEPVVTIREHRRSPQRASVYAIGTAPCVECGAVVLSNGGGDIGRSCDDCRRG